MPKFREIEPEGDVFLYVFCALAGNREGNFDFEACALMAAEAKLWCQEQFGTSRPVWDKLHGRYRWKLTATRAKFMNADDAFAFKLRWC